MMELPQSQLEKVQWHHQPASKGSPIS